MRSQQSTVPPRAPPLVAAAIATKRSKTSFMVMVLTMRSFQTSQRYANPLSMASRNSMTENSPSFGPSTMTTSSACPHLDRFQNSIRSRASLSLVIVFMGIFVIAFLVGIGLSLVFVVAWT
jgi:hypothetical protein